MAPIIHARYHGAITCRDIQLQLVVIYLNYCFHSFEIEINMSSHISITALLVTSYISVWSSLHNNHIGRHALLSAQIGICTEEEQKGC